HLQDFVVWATGQVISPPGWSLVLFVLLVLPGCSKPDSPNQVEDSPDSGRITLVVAPELRVLMVKEVESFMALYPKATIELRTGRSREAVGELFGGRADLIAVARDLEAEERSVAVQGGIELDGYRFARDGICMIVNETSHIENLAVEEIRRIYRGEVVQWAPLGGDGRVVPVVQPLDSDPARAFVQQVLEEQSITTPSQTVADDSAAVAFVAHTAGAIAYVSLSAAGAKGVRVLKVAPVIGLPYRSPDAESVYQGNYPLTRYCNLYVRTKGAPLAGGFVTYVTSRPGQIFVHESGLVPTAVPVRFVRRSPLISTH
ncbi:MAG: substrate-binding domain-containing protein, partial [Candidatus Eisenbacteria bacterium]